MTSHGLYDKCSFHMSDTLSNIVSQCTDVFLDTFQYSLIEFFCTYRFWTEHGNCKTCTFCEIWKENCWCWIKLQVCLCSLCIWCSIL